MFNPLLMTFAETLRYQLIARFIVFAQCLRYRVRVRFEGSARTAVLDNSTGTLVIFNHPTWGVEGMRVFAELALLRVKPLLIVAEEQLESPVLAPLAKRFETVSIPDMTRGAGDFSALEMATQGVIKALNEKRLVVIAGSGRIYRSRTETLGGMVSKVLTNKPNARVVSAYADGLWGSRLSFAATGQYPNAGSVLGKGFVSILANGILFSPRHPWSLTFKEQTRELSSLNGPQINEYFKALFNTTENGPGHPRAARLYPLYWWHHVQPLADPIIAQVAGDIHSVPETVRLALVDKLVELTGDKSLKSWPLDSPEILGKHLRDDLGMDSMSTGELVAWIQDYTLNRTGTAFEIQSTDNLISVQDAILAANGAAKVETGMPMKGPSPRWLADSKTKSRMEYKWDGVPFTLRWLERAIAHPKDVTIADPMFSSPSNRRLLQILIGILPAIRQIPGERVGVLLPSGVVAFVATHAIRLAGKVPVFLNHTTGASAVQNAVRVTGITHVLTLGLVLSKIGWGDAEKETFGIEWVEFEKIARGLTKKDKVRVLFKSLFGARALLKTSLNKNAGILVTSGSEGMPKCIGFTDEMFGIFVSEMVRIIEPDAEDRVLQTGPPFHVLGYIAGIVIPSLTDMRIGLLPNPTDFKAIANFTELYRIRRVVSPPAFAEGMAVTSLPGQLANLEHLVYGAQAMSPGQRASILQRAPHVSITEGYGATETTGGLMFAPTYATEKGWMRMVESATYKLLNAEDMKTEVGPGEVGAMHVRGPTIITSYQRPAREEDYTPSLAFVQIDGETYFKTGDLLERHKTNPRLFRFYTRESRTFKNKAGEYVNPDYIEAALSIGLPRKDSDEKGVLFAVTGAPQDSHKVAVLFSTRDVPIADVNAAIFAQGHSQVFRVEKVHHVKTIPMAGSGKVALSTINRWAKELQDPSASKSPDLMAALH